MLVHTTRNALSLLRVSNGSLSKLTGCNVTRTLANTTDNKPTNNKPTNNKPTNNKPTDTKPKSTTKSTTATMNVSEACSVPSSKKVDKVSTSQEKLAKPSPPSDKYESPEYFKYPEYSYNDLITEMEKMRNPQPAPK